MKARESLPFVNEPAIDHIPTSGAASSWGGAVPCEQKGAPSVWEQEFLDELFAYTGFTADHAERLRALRPHVEPAFPAIVERFYEAARANPRAASVFTGGAAQLERHKEFLRDWLDGVVGGVYDVDYLRVRARIGRTHVRIRLDQRYMFAAMNLVREGLHQGLAESAYPVAERLFAHQAIDKICDLELAIMLQTYSEDYLVRMRDNERLATLGQLAGFIGHELRNPLAVMETSLHLLKRRIQQQDEHVQRHLRRVAEQVDTCGSIISDLVELARDRPLERTKVEVGPLLEACIAAQDLEGEDITVSLTVEPGLAPALLDGKQVKRLVANLLTNAVEALRGASGPRKLSIRAGRRGDCLVLEVADSGPGVAEEVRHRLFEPLATTRAKGLGLGLALCRRIAEKHEGEILVHNLPDGGAHFEVRLCRAFT